jgi:hypothetical protein
MPNLPPQPPISPPLFQLTPDQTLDWHKWTQEQNIAWQKWVYEQNVHAAELATELNVKSAERAHDRSHEFATRANEAAIQGGNLALRMGLLINGGAAVALLTFLGTLTVDQKRSIAPILAWFAWGVVFASVALVAAYFTNRAVSGTERSKKWQWEEPHVKDGPHTRKWKVAYWVFFAISVIIGLGSLGLFVAGMWAAQDALTKLPPSAALL